MADVRWKYQPDTGVRKCIYKLLQSPNAPVLLSRFRDIVGAERFDRIAGQMRNHADFTAWYDGFKKRELAEMGKGSREIAPGQIEAIYPIPWAAKEKSKPIYVKGINLQ